MSLASTTRHFDILHALAKDAVVSKLDQGDMRLLAYLAKQSDSVAVGELAVGAGMHPTSLFRATQRLEKSGLIRRVSNKADGRSWLISLTRKGQNVNDRIAELFRDPPSNGPSPKEE